MGAFQLAIGWVLFVVVAVASVAFGFVAAFVFMRRTGSGKSMPLLVSALTLGISFNLMLVIPLDVLTVSSSNDHTTGEALISSDDLNTRQFVVRLVYYISYGALVALVFVLSPFAYFWFEETPVDSGVYGGEARPRASFGRRLFTAGKYSIATTLVIAVLLGVGLAVTSAAPQGDAQSIDTYAKQLFENTSWPARAGAFVLAVLTIIGYLAFVTYTAIGFSIVPLSMLRRRRSVDDEHDEVSHRLGIVRSQRRQSAALSLTPKRGGASAEDRRRLLALESDEEKLSRQQRTLRAASSGVARCVGFFRPFRVLLGVVFLIISLLLVAALLLSNAYLTRQKLSASGCTSSVCSYVLADVPLFQPVDSALTWLARYFPLDVVVYGIMAIFMYFMTIGGVTSLSIRLLWIRLYRVRRGKTPPQGVLMLSAICGLSVLAMSATVLVLAPQYSRFGTQTVNAALLRNVSSSAGGDTTPPPTSVTTTTTPAAALHYGRDTVNNVTTPINTNATVTPCTINVACALGVLCCAPSVLATMHDVVNTHVSFFGLVSFFAVWLFLAIYLIGLIGSSIVACRARSNLADDDDDDIENDDDNDDDDDGNDSYRYRSRRLN